MVTMLAPKCPEAKREEEVERGFNPFHGELLIGHKNTGTALPIGS